jgi:hypothetical protein
MGVSRRRWATMSRRDEIEYRLVPCGTETGELELENLVGIPR